MVDTHAHLNSEGYVNNLEEILIETNINLEFIINVGTNIQTSKEVILLNKKYPKFYPTIGIHPTDAIDNKIDDLRSIVTDKVIAIGEIGLDYSRDGYNKELQINLFKEQLDLARELKLPVICHIRDAIEDSLNILKEYPDLKIILHSWSGNIDQTTRAMLNENIYFSFNGISTFKNADDIRKSIKIIPLGRMLLETDCPWLTPVPLRGKVNSPLNMKYIIENIRIIKGFEKSFSDFDNLLTNNAKEFFNIHD